MGSSLTNMHIIRENLLRGFCKFYLFTAVWFSWSVQKHNATKIFLAIRETKNSCKIVAIIHPTKLVTNSY